jgi:hypothetical protein
MAKGSRGGRQLPATTPEAVKGEPYGSGPEPGRPLAPALAARDARARGHLLAGQAGGGIPPARPPLRAGRPALTAQGMTE